MANTIKIDFQAPGAVESGDLVVFVGEDLKPAPAVARLLGPGVADLVARAAGPERFKGKAQSVLTVAAPAGLGAERLIVFGIGVWYILKLMSHPPHAGETGLADAPVRTAGITPSPSMGSGGADARPDVVEEAV